MVDPRISIPDWIPTTDSKFNTKQATSHIPASLPPIARQIFLKRYVCDVGQRDSCKIDWADFTKTNQKLDTFDSDDLNAIASKLPNDYLFNTRIGVSCRTSMVMTVSVYCTFGTLPVQGIRCANWVREELVSC